MVTAKLDLSWQQMVVTMVVFVSVFIVVALPWKKFSSHFVNCVFLHRRVAELETKLRSVVNSLSSGASSADNQHVMHSDIFSRNSCLAILE